MRDNLTVSLIQRISALEVAVAKLIGGHRSEQPASSHHIEDTALRKTLNPYITATPALLSLLYDIDLLPEQTQSGTRESAVMCAIAQAWKANAETQPPPASVWHDAKGDWPKTAGHYLVIVQHIADSSTQIWIGDYSAGLQSWDLVGDDFIPFKPWIITHWTELPPPP